MDRQPHPAKNILKKAGITQKMIAEYFGISHTWTRAILNGRATVSRTRDRQLWELVNKVKNEK